MEHPADFPSILRRSDSNRLQTRDKIHIPLHDTTNEAPKFSLPRKAPASAFTKGKNSTKSRSEMSLHKPSPVNFNNNSIYHDDYFLKSSYKDVGRIPDFSRYTISVEPRRDYVNRKLSNDSLDSGTGKFLMENGGGKNGINGKKSGDKSLQLDRLFSCDLEETAEDGERKEQVIVW